MRATQFAVASVLAGLGSCFVAVMPVAAQRSAPQPNIIHIVADDLGWADVGFHGSDITTPNIDQLAKTGATLEQFYVQPMCTPTRAALMTGRYPLRYGLQTLVIPASLSYGLPTDEWLLPQALKEAGYTTAILGKWHLGHAKREFWPKQRGFDYQYGAQLGEIDYFTHSVGGKTDWYRNNKPVNEKGYVTTLYQASKRLTDGSPIALSDRGDAACLGEKFSPSVLAGVEDGGVIREHAVAEIGLAQILPDVLGRVEFGTSGRQRNKGEVAGWVELARGVPSGLVEDEQRMGPRRDGAADRLEMCLHGLGVGVRHDKGNSGIAARTDGAEYIGVLVALILGLAWP